MHSFGVATLSKSESGVFFRFSLKWVQDPNEKRRRSASLSLPLGVVGKLDNIRTQRSDVAFAFIRCGYAISICIVSLKRLYNFHVKFPKILKVSNPGSKHSMVGGRPGFNISYNSSSFWGYKTVI